MDNQHKRISGYRDLNPFEITAMNEIKEFEAKWNGLVERLRLFEEVDQRNLSLAITYCEDGFSRAVRAIAKPERIVS